MRTQGPRIPPSHKPRARGRGTRQEADDSFRFDSMQHEYEKRYRDPDDVFFQAQDRRREIKDQIRELQKGLERQGPRRKSRSTKKKQKRARK